MRGNDYLFEKYVDGFDHHYLAYKFVYNSEFSLEEYVKILGYDFVRNFPFETIINGELKYDVHERYAIIGSRRNISYH